MTTNDREVHIEHLLGRRVRDQNGAVLGRLEEFVVDTVHGEAVVVEFHVGTAALLVRLGGFMLELPILSLLRRASLEYRFPWTLMDLTDPRRPVVRAAKKDLHLRPREGR